MSDITTTSIFRPILYSVCGFSTYSVLCSYLGPDTGYPDWIFHSRSEGLQANALQVPTKPQPLFRHP